MPMFKPREPKARAMYELAVRKHRQYCDEMRRMVQLPDFLFDEEEFDRIATLRFRWMDVRKRHAWSRPNRP